MRFTYEPGNATFLAFKAGDIVRLKSPERYSGELQSESMPVGTLFKVVPTGDARTFESPHVTAKLLSAEHWSKAKWLEESCLELASEEDEVGATREARVLLGYMPDKEQLVEIIERADEDADAIQRRLGCAMVHLHLGWREVRGAVLRPRGAGEGGPPAVAEEDQEGEGPRVHHR